MNDIKYFIWFEVSEGAHVYFMYMEFYVHQLNGMSKWYAFVANFFLMHF